MSIVRIGMGEHRNYADGFDAIFSKKKAAPKAKAAKKPAKKTTKKSKKK